MLKIILNGDAGFIGSHIIKSCMENGHEVVIMKDIIIKDGGVN
ncbi:MAG: NAD-dependent epimerase/dehydratase family protein [Methanosarcinales archaeon]|nr:NAD-dependent epimerase/dehydratase family protein [Methanosarcinales archaeon]